MLNRKKNNKGFTLVELLVVIAIIGILAVVAVPALFKNIEKGKIADLEADISAIRSAALSVYADTSVMPNNETIDGDKTKGSSNLIDAELEGLSNPFNGTYTTTMVDTDKDNENDTLLLKIELENAISKDGAQKLINDLGDKYVNKDGSVIESAAPISAEGNIYIKLMEK